MFTFSLQDRFGIIHEITNCPLSNDNYNYVYRLVKNDEVIKTINIRYEYMLSLIERLEMIESKKFKLSIE